MNVFLLPFTQYTLVGATYNAATALIVSVVLRGSKTCILFVIAILCVFCAVPSVLLFHFIRGIFEKNTKYLYRYRGI